MDVCPNKVVYLNQEERNFFIKCLKNLLTLVDIKKSKEAKATIAANIMFLIKKGISLDNFIDFYNKI